MRNDNLSQEDIEALLKEAEGAFEEANHVQGPSAGQDSEEAASDRELPVQNHSARVDHRETAPQESEGVRVQPSIHVADFEEFQMEPVSEKPISDMGVLLDIPLSISVELGKSKCYVKDLLNLTVGSIVELDRLAGDPVDILVNGKIFAKGEVVVIDENFGVRIQEVLGKGKGRKHTNF